MVYYNYFSLYHNNFFSRNSGINDDNSFIISPQSQDGVTIRTIQTSTLLYKTLPYIFKSYTLESHVVHIDPKQKSKINSNNINLLALIMLIKIGSSFGSD